MNVKDYLSEVQKVYRTGAATEHSYRSTLQYLFSSIDSNIVALNEPKRVKCGAPDFLIAKNRIIIGHAEAKDIGKDLGSLKDRDAEQKQRYLKALPNLIYTNCLDFEFYRNGMLQSKVSVADLGPDIRPKPHNFAALTNQLNEFASQKLQTISSPEQLAVLMAGKANLIKDILYNALRDDKDRSTELTEQYHAFKEHLIHDIKISEFSDIYAETIAYGMFAARLHDTTLDDFSRQEAIDLLPKSNPFLRSLFTYIAGPDLDDRIRWIIDDLAETFIACDVKKLLKNFGSLTGRDDPFLHFYETFLAKYNPNKRRARGVWYTPEPVVQFIVRAVDDVLKTEFGLAAGLADTSKVVTDWDTGQRATTKKGQLAKSEKTVIIKKEVHRVQILDPATGTGTFLAEAIKQIAPQVKRAGSGVWSNYIEHNLIPRVHGFELLMASYSMCHMKLDMVLSELGYVPSGQPPRLSVYLTNSLEEGEPANQVLPFAQWLSNEVREANTIKRDMPIMCVIGNPPYRGHSANAGKWIRTLIDAYKREPGGVTKLKERNSKWLNDDYVKFIRLAEHLIERNGEGVVGFITNHGYLDNPTFRGMRWHLLKTFDKIYVLDLHGSSKKKEVSPDRSPDKNVFDIQQGVAIIIGIKRSGASQNKPLGQVFCGDLWGSRKEKYAELRSKSLETMPFVQAHPKEPQYYFGRRNWDLEDVYSAGFKLDEFFSDAVLGFQTHRDKFAIENTRAALLKKLNNLMDSSLSDEELHSKYGTKDNRDWKLAKQRLKLKADKNWQKKVTACLYRPFDVRVCHLDYATMDYPRSEIVLNVLNRENVCLLASRQLSVEGYRHCLVTNLPAESCAISLQTKEQNQVFFLYTYPAEDDLDQRRRVNFNASLYEKLRTLGEHPEHGKPDELVVFDYIYGVLHSDAYRARFAQFLKADFPRIPWPKSAVEFWSVADKGGQLRGLHLMEPQTSGEVAYPFEGDGDMVIKEPAFRDNKVWINKTQHFDNVPEVAWSFWIGGYQPSQKWLKDRKGRGLSFDDILHYQMILGILVETHRIMKTINLTIET